MFSKDELGVIESLAKGKKLTDEQKDLVDGLKEKLGAHTQAVIPERFVELTGWSNPATDYPA